MSKKLLFNEKGEKLPVINKFTITKTNYPIEIVSELLDEEEKTYIEEIEGNTVQNENDLLDISSVGEKALDEVYEIEIIQSACPYEFGKGGSI